MPDYRNQRLISSLILMIIIMTLCSGFSTSGDYEKLNVIFIMIDDLRPELGCYGKKQVITPNIDQLALRSVLFENAYCQYSWCSPSRTSVLTGLRPDKTKVYDLKTHFRTTTPGVVTLPQYFRQHGYTALAFGKVFHNDPALQDSLSWDEPCWFPPGDDPIYAYADSANLSVVRTTGKPFARPVESADVPDNGYPDGQLTEEVLRRLEHNSSKPFFIAVGFYKPHLPYTAPKKYFDRYDPALFDIANSAFPSGSPDYSLRTRSEEMNYLGVGERPYTDSLKRALTHGYYACTSYIDEQVGKILRKLEALSLDKNTIVVIWGDHGYKLGEYGHWSKHSNFEVDTRVPLIIHHPRINGQKIPAVTESLDIYPTVCALARLPVPDHTDGSVLFEEGAHSKSRKDFAISQIQHGRYMGYSIRNEHFRYTRWIDFKTREITAEELYDHSSDPGEKRNVAGERRFKKEKQRLKLMMDSVIR